MIYKVLLSPLARQNLIDILYNDDSPYTPAERLTYVEAIERYCYSLDLFPKRVEPVMIKGRAYWRVFYKAHTVYYRVFDDRLTVEIDAVLHRRMVPDGSL